MFALGAEGSSDPKKYLDLGAEIANTCHESYDRAGNYSHAFWMFKMLLNTIGGLFRIVLFAQNKADFLAEKHYETRLFKYIEKYTTKKWNLSDEKFW